MKSLLFRRYLAWMDDKTETKPITAGMLRALLEEVRNEPEGMEIIERNLKVTLREIELGLEQDTDENSLLALIGLLYIDGAPFWCGGGKQSRRHLLLTSTFHPSTDVKPFGDSEMSDTFHFLSAHAGDEAGE
ncbi:MAG: hypothetical protein U5K75_09520 [Ahrensia sp.]|nr:hypothetical protein [Ahrensia sp.]